MRTAREVPTHYLRPNERVRIPQRVIYLDTESSWRDLTLVAVAPLPRDVVVTDVTPGGFTVTWTSDPGTGTLATFNCYACHQRGGLGGVDPNKNVDLDDDEPALSLDVAERTHFCNGR